MFARASSRPLNRGTLHRHWFLLLAGLWLAGCAARPTTPLPDITPWEARKALLGGLDAWAFNGRVAVRTAADGFNGKLRYRHTGDNFEAVLSGPLGIGTVQLVRDEGVLVFTDKDGIVTEFTDPEIDLEYRFGWDVPLESLRYWALGIPDPARPADTALNADGQLASMAQGGWDIEVTRYDETGGEVMPKRLTVTSETTKVTLFIDRWDFSESF